MHVIICFTVRVRACVCMYVGIVPVWGHDGINRLTMQTPGWSGSTVIIRPGCVPDSNPTRTFLSTFITFVVLSWGFFFFFFFAICMLFVFLLKRTFRSRHSCQQCASEHTHAAVVCESWRRPRAVSRWFAMHRACTHPMHSRFLAATHLYWLLWR